MLRCHEFGFAWDVPADEAAAMIARLGASYRWRLHDFTTEVRARDQPDLIRTRPSPDGWSALEYTAHMRDVVDFYMDRIERVLREDRPILLAADFASMAETRRTGTKTSRQCSSH
jgi:hypothetical protein